MRPHRFLGSAALALTLLLSGCFNSRVHIPLDSHYAEARGRGEPSLASFFAYARARATPEAGDVVEEERETHTVRLLQFRSLGINGQDGNLIRARYHRGKAPGKKALVIVLPIWGSYTYPPEEIAAGIVARGNGRVSVLHLLGERPLFDWEAIQASRDPDAFSAAVRSGLLERIRVMVVDIRRVLDWADEQPDVDRRNTAIVGFSESALVAGYALAADPRFSAGVLVMGGARPGDIMAVCDGWPELTKDAVSRRFGWSPQHYRDALQKIFAPFEMPPNAARVPAGRIMMFDAFFDSCMPASSRNALWDAMGRPERISFLYDHRTSFLSMTPLGGYYMRHKIYGFLEDRLRVPPAALTAGGEAR